MTHCLVSGSKRPCPQYDPPAAHRGPHDNLLHGHQQTPAHAARRSHMRKSSLRMNYSRLGVHPIEDTLPNLLVRCATSEGTFADHLTSSGCCKMPSPRGSTAEQEVAVSPKPTTLLRHLGASGGRHSSSAWHVFA
jgi:hypothetical protein